MRQSLFNVFSQVYAKVYHQPVPWLLAERPSVDGLLESVLRDFGCP